MNRFLNQFHSSANIIKKFKNEVTSINLEMLRVMSISSVVIIGLLVFVSIISGLFEKDRFIYALWLITSSIFAGISCFLKKQMEKYATLCLFLFCFIIWGISIVSGTIYFAESNSGAVVGYIVIFGFVMLDYPWRFCLTESMMCFIFCTMSIMNKEFSIAVIDCTNSITFTAVACILGTKSIHLKALDISQRATIIRQRDTDMLTGVSNRHAFEKMMYAHIFSHSGMAALVMIDLDFFKNVNDTLGHRQGDALLRNVATDIKRQFRASDCVARLGGDEFVVFIKEVPNQVWLYKKAQDLNDVIRRTVRLGDAECSISASIGISVYNGTQTFEMLYDQADQAMYQAKKNGRDSFWIFGVVEEAGSSEV